jgi:uncharacterized protein YndB with AHSA1/START domain
MRWILWIIGGTVVVAIIIVAVGYMLPRSHVASVSATYEATPDALWATLTDVSAFPAWRSDVTRVEVLPDENGQRRWREHGKNGTITYRLIESTAPQRLVTRIDDQDLPFGGTWTYELAPAGNGTRLTITERGEVYNPVFRFVSRFIMGYTGTMTGMLKALGAKHGETVTPVAGAAT